MNYQKFDSLLTGRCRQQKKIGNNTIAHRIDDKTIGIKLHATDVVVYHQDGRVVLNSGGWRTVTTKDRINNYSSARIGQCKGVWTLHGHNGAVFADGLTIHPDGSVTGDAPASK